MQSTNFFSLRQLRSTYFLAMNCSLRALSYQPTLNLTTMTPATPNEKLNFVLSYINQERSYNELYREIDEHANFKGQFSPGEIDLIMDKLRSDGYIDFIAGQSITANIRASNGINIRKNFNGSVFIVEGGYIQKAIDDKKEKDLRDSRDKRLSNGTVYLAIGTFLLVLVEALIHRHDLISLFSCH